MGSCLGVPKKSQTIPGRTSKLPRKMSISRLPTRERRRWSSSSEPMANSVSISNSLETCNSQYPPPSDSHRSETQNASDDSFVNHATIAWAAQRSAWVGDQTSKTHRTIREPIISWCTTYEDLLSTSNKFLQPIPLSEMVDFLVDIWHEEGLYD
ncbi:hypothetical protein HPP92_004687 [Vanilla planifolia]|uniref:Gag1-like clamp domain-containing protein n=1 Tax=Vanilla planifolia TaxID=51239 RepID=A0A835RN99_VANPL|nr:hypothetical protein HPP92_005032 [Vanilla planifolia]KAG0493693.1 hypothetical protein HPP92_004687 [Vanilla planifolia]